MDRTELRQTLMDQLAEDKISYPAGLPDHLGLRDGLGLDSIEVVNLVVNTQCRFGIELRGDELEKIVSVGDLLDLLQRKIDPSRSAA